MMYSKRKKDKILIVDDSKMNRMILADMLGEKYHVMEAENGRTAIELLQAYETEISLILLDIIMPEMDGFEAVSYTHLIPEMSTSWGR